MPGVVPAIIKPDGLDHRGAEPQAGPHDRQAHPPGLPGRARHGADHGGRLRQQGVLSPRPGPVVRRAAAVAQQGGGRALQPEEPGQGARSSSQTPATPASPSAGSPPRNTSGCTRTRWWPSSSWRRSASRSISRWSTGPRWCSGATSRRCGTSSRPASRSTRSPRFSTAVRATGRAGGATRTRSSGWRRSAARAIPGSGAAMWEKVQTLFYEDVGRIKFGDYFGLTGRPQGSAGLSRDQRDEPLERVAGSELARVKTYVLRRLLALIAGGAGGGDGGLRPDPPGARRSRLGHRGARRLAGRRRAHRRDSSASTRRCRCSSCAGTGAWCRATSASRSSCASR